MFRWTNVFMYSIKNVRSRKSCVGLPFDGNIERHISIMMTLLYDLDLCDVAAWDWTRVLLKQAFCESEHSSDICMIISVIMGNYYKKCTEFIFKKKQFLWKSRKRSCIQCLIILHSNWKCTLSQDLAALIWCIGPIFPGLERLEMTTDNNSPWRDK